MTICLVRYKLVIATDVDLVVYILSQCKGPEPEQNEVAAEAKIRLQAQAGLR